MASDLILRLCQVDPDEGGLPYDQHIAIADFVGGLIDLLGGYHTPIEMKTFYNMPPVQQADFDVLVAKINSAATVALRIGRIQRFRSILNKWERKNDLNLSGYDTPDDIQTQLMAIDTGF